MTPSDAGDAIPGLWFVRGHDAGCSSEQHKHSLTADDARRGAQMAIMCLQMLVLLCSEIGIGSCWCYRRSHIPDQRSPHCDLIKPNLPLEQGMANCHPMQTSFHPHLTALQKQPVSFH
jgi:hypothetical protein